jgi:hypothetical protein
MMEWVGVIIRDGGHFGIMDIVMVCRLGVLK